ncbi:hypothetical protein Taro_047423, partial [Colocasia esculenta]|nr:hypothetical protein [Colocasia esculenta]
MSLGVRTRVSSRPQHPRVLCFLLHHQWTMECSCRERADMWWSSILRTQFEDGAVEVAWDEFVRLFRAKFVLEHIQDKMEKAKKFVMGLRPSLRMRLVAFDHRTLDEVLSAECRVLEGCFFLLKMKDYDAILGLDWIEEHYALVDCRGKKIVFRIP